MFQAKEAGLPAWVSRRLITVDDYYRMAETGILTAEDRVELIEGQIVEMPAIGSEHAARVNRLTRLLVLAVGNRGILSVQNPVRLSNILEPEPDFAVLKPREDEYAEGHPNAADVLLLIEVSDTSLEYDQRVKATLYARHGVREFWIVNVRKGEVTVHRHPKGDDYEAISVASGQDRLTIDALPGVSLGVADIFPG